MKGAVGIIARVFSLLVLASATLYFLIAPGVALVMDLRDPALRQPGIPERSWRLHQDLAPRIAQWASGRVKARSGEEAPLYDVPTTEWPMFTAVFYLLATEQLQASWQQGDHHGHPEPLSYSREAIEESKNLILDPAHHTWVRTHWGADYMHRENVFFRALVISGLTSHAKLTGDRTHLPLLRDQVETLAAALDSSERGLLHDYPGECYPIDVLVAIAFIQRADPVLGTDHSEFVARSLRAFEGAMSDDLGLVPYRTDLGTYEQDQPSRGIGNSWVLLFAPDLWPEPAARWYGAYEQAFWQQRWWAEGFREFARDRGQAEWQVEVDAGPVLGGFGTSASAFGIAAARRNGRFDHAFILSSQFAAASWTLPDGTLLGPRVLSHAAAAPYLGESAMLYFLTVQPKEGAKVVTGGKLPGLVYVGFIVYFGVGGLLLALVAAALRRTLSGYKRPRTPTQLGETTSAVLGSEAFPAGSLDR